jgi:hypothetical protein
LIQNRENECSDKLGNSSEKMLMQKYADKEGLQSIFLAWADIVHLLSIAMNVQAK